MRCSAKLPGLSTPEYLMTTTDTPTFTSRTPYPRSQYMRPITTKQSQEFKAAIVARLEGQLRPAHFPAEWILLTSCGWLRVSLPHTISGDIFSVFTRFEGSKGELSKAVELIGSDHINPYSGKWNVHCQDAAGAYEAFCRQLEQVDVQSAPILLGELSFESYSAPGGPGVYQRVVHYQRMLSGLKFQAETGNKLAQQDYVVSCKPDSLVNTIIWNYLCGNIDAEMSFSMRHDWQEHVSKLQPA